MRPLVSIVTATIGHERFPACMRSIDMQTYPNIQHLVFIDGHRRVERPEPSRVRRDWIGLPYQVGGHGYGGHRMYGAGTHLCDGDYIMFLDDDNTLWPDHVESLVAQLEAGADCAFSFRNIVTGAGFLCEDNCESLGLWPSYISETDYMVDMNCYMFTRRTANRISPIWATKFREPGQVETDRAICHLIREYLKLDFRATGRYTLNYYAGNRVGVSVDPATFIKGNIAQLEKYDGILPWKVYA